MLHPDIIAALRLAHRRHFDDGGFAGGPDPAASFENNTPQDAFTVGPAMYSTNVAGTPFDGNRVNYQDGTAPQPQPFAGSYGGISAFPGAFSGNQTMGAVRNPAPQPVGYRNQDSYRQSYSNRNFQQPGYPSQNFQPPGYPTQNMQSFAPQNSGFPQYSPHPMQGTPNSPSMQPQQPSIGQNPAQSFAQNPAMNRNSVSQAPSYPWQNRGNNNPFGGTPFIGKNGGGSAWPNRGY